MVCFVPRAVTIRPSGSRGPSGLLRSGSGHTRAHTAAALAAASSAMRGTALTMSLRILPAASEPCTITSSWLSWRGWQVMEKGEKAVEAGSS
jgi:hypothetical protein